MPDLPGIRILRSRRQSNKTLLLISSVPPSLHARCRNINLLAIGCGFRHPLGPDYPLADQHRQGNLVLSACGDLTRIAVTCSSILTSHRASMAHAFTFIAMGTLSYRLHSANTVQALSFGTTFKPRLSSARNLSMSELLRFLSRMAASKPTSSLSVKLHLLVMYLT